MFDVLRIDRNYFSLILLFGLMVLMYFSPYPNPAVGWGLFFLLGIMLGRVMGREPADVSLLVGALFVMQGVLVFASSLPLWGVVAMFLLYGGVLAFMTLRHRRDYTIE